MMAAKVGRVEIVRKLLKHKANKDITNKVNYVGWDDTLFYMTIIAILTGTVQFQ